LADLFKKIVDKVIGMSKAIGDEKTFDLLSAVMDIETKNDIVFNDVLIEVNRLTGIDLHHIRTKSKNSLSRTIAIDLLVVLLKENTNWNNKEIADKLGYYTKGVQRAMNRFKNLNEKIAYERKEIEYYNIINDRLNLKTKQ